MKKRKSLSKLIDEAATLLQKLVRLKAADDNGYVSCVTCGSTKNWKEMDGGHFISRRYLATKLMEENVHPQCKGCNGPRSGNLINYTLYMQDTYGREFVEELEELKSHGRKYYRSEVEKIISDLKESIKEYGHLTGS